MNDLYLTLTFSLILITTIIKINNIYVYNIFLIKDTTRIELNVLCKGTHGRSSSFGNCVNIELIFVRSFEISDHPIPQFHKDFIELLFTRTPPFVCN